MYSFFLMFSIEVDASNQRQNVVIIIFYRTVYEFRKHFLRYTNVAVFTTFLFEAYADVFHQLPITLCRTLRLPAITDHELIVEIIRPIFIAFPFSCFHDCRRVGFSKILSTSV